MTTSKDGRRVIVAPVTGEIGDRIQVWRQKHDPEQARRLPPHATVLYWANIAPEDEDALDGQIRHAFLQPIKVRLGGVHLFDNPDRTRYINVEDTETLNASRARLFDGTHLTLPEQRTVWDWHVTVVRYGRKREKELIDAPFPDIVLNDVWTIDTLLWLELRDGVYEEVRRWRLG